MQVVFLWWRCSDSTQRHFVLKESSAINYVECLIKTWYIVQINKAGLRELHCDFLVISFFHRAHTTAWNKVVWKVCVEKILLIPIRQYQKNCVHASGVNIQLIIMQVAMCVILSYINSLEEFAFSYFKHKKLCICSIYNIFSNLTITKYYSKQWW